MQECTFVVGIDSVVVVSMSDMSTFDKESLYENETCENRKNNDLQHECRYRES